MKKLLGLILFTSILISQDVLTTSSNKKYLGEVVRVEEYYVFFKLAGMANNEIQKIPKWTIKNIRKGDGSLLDFPDVTEIPLELMSDEQREKFEKQENQREQERLVREKCESNRLLRFMVIPIKDDYYGLTEEVETSLDSLCYSVQDNVDGLAYLDEKKISGEDINDFHLTSIGKEMKLDFILYGYTYIVEEPFKYSGNPSATAPTTETDLYSGGFLMEVFDYLILADIASTEDQKRAAALSQAGTFLGFSLFQIDVITGEKKY